MIYIHTLFGQLRAILQSNSAVTLRIATWMSMDEIAYKMDMNLIKYCVVIEAIF